MHPQDLTRGNEVLLADEIFDKNLLTTRSSTSCLTTPLLGFQHVVPRAEAIKQFQKQKYTANKNTMEAQLQILCSTFYSLLEEAAGGWKRKRLLRGPVQKNETRRSADLSDEVSINKPRLSPFAAAAIPAPR